MGFTRYWTIKKEIPQDKFDEFIEYAKMVVEYHKREGIKLGNWSGEGGEPEFEKDSVSLNGVGDESHDTFVINRIPEVCKWDRSNDVLEFCKTAHKPYDTPVYELLYLTRYIFGEDYIEYSSDYEPEKDDYSRIKEFIRNYKIEELVK